MKNRIICVILLSFLLFTPIYSQRSVIKRSIGKIMGKNIVEEISEQALTHELKSVSRQYSRKLIRKKMSKYCSLRGAKDIKQLISTTAKDKLFKYSNSFSKNLEGKEIRKFKYKQNILDQAKNSKATSKKNLKALTKNGIKKYANKVPSHLKNSKQVNKCIENLRKKFPHTKDMSYEIIEHPNGSYEVFLKGHPGNTSTKMKVRPDGVIEVQSYTHAGKSGSIGHNEFIKNLIPNSTYKIEPGITCITDSKGRVSKLQCNLKQSASGGKSPERNREYQKYVANSNLSDKAKKTGKEYRGGHLIQFSQGGPDELQIPMLKEINNEGDWYKLEALERSCISKGEDVLIDLHIIYDKDGFPASFTKTLKLKEKTISLTCDNFTGETYIKEILKG